MLELLENEPISDWIELKMITKDCPNQLRGLRDKSDIADINMPDKQGVNEKWEFCR